jgi:hypothetical protein
VRFYGQGGIFVFLDMKTPSRACKRILPRAVFLRALFGRVHFSERAAFPRVP